MEGENMINQIKGWAIEQVIWAENNLHGKSGAEKRAAVIKKLDDMITLPACLEWLDEIIIGKLVDTTCERLNAMTEHNFKEIELSEKQEQELAENIKMPEGES